MRKAQAEAAKRDARRRRIVTIVGGVVVLALVGAIVFAVVQAARDDGGGAASGEVVVPANVDDVSIPVGDADAPTTVSVYFDYMCPACGRFEEANGPDVDRLVEDGDILLELRPISFLDRNSGGSQFSTRSANALLTVADGSPEHVLAFHQGLFVNQPTEGGSGLSDSDMRQIALDAGVPEDVVDRFSGRTYDGWIAEKTEEAFDSGIQGTPTVFIDGEEFTDVYTPGSLVREIESR